MTKYTFPPDKANEIIQCFAHRLERKLFMRYCAYHNDEKALELAKESTQEFINMSIFDNRPLTGTLPHDIMGM